MWTSNRLYKAGLALLSVFLLAASPAYGDPALDDLVSEALRNSPEIQASKAGIEAARQRIPQAGSLPDPTFTVGYQNEGFDNYTFGVEQGAQWMFSVSQPFFFPGKRALKKEATLRDAESLEALHEQLKLRTAARVEELYYDLFLAYKTLDLISDQRELFIWLEEVTRARYAAGKAVQQDVLIAQTEKYLLLEKEAVFRQKIQSLSALLSSAVGRQRGAAIPKPAEPVYQPFSLTLDDAIEMALSRSPEIRSRSKIIEASSVRLRSAQKEYYPDFALGGSYFNRGYYLNTIGERGKFLDMWSLTATINIPIYFRSKQKPAVSEAQAILHQTDQDLKSTKLVIEAAVRDNYAVLRSAERLMEIYKDGLIPQNNQTIDQSLTRYSTGGAEASSVISRVKTSLDYETQYWSQFVEREKAISRLRAITAGLTAGGK